MNRTRVVFQKLTAQKCLKRELSANIKEFSYKKKLFLKINDKIYYKYKFNDHHLESFNINYKLNTNYWMKTDIDIFLHVNNGMLHNDQPLPSTIIDQWEAVCQIYLFDIRLLCWLYVLLKLAWNSSWHSCVSSSWVKFRVDISSENTNLGTLWKRKLASDCLRVERTMEHATEHAIWHKGSLVPPDLSQSIRRLS